MKQTYVYDVHVELIKLRKEEANSPTYVIQGMKFPNPIITGDELRLSIGARHPIDLESVKVWHFNDLKTKRPKSVIWGHCKYDVTLDGLLANMTDRSRNKYNMTIKY